MSGAVVGVVEIIAGVIIDIASEGLLSPLGDGLIAAGASTLLGYAASLLLNPHRQTLVPIGAAFSSRSVGISGLHHRASPAVRAPDRGYLRDLAFLKDGTPQAPRIQVPVLFGRKALAGEPVVRLYREPAGGKIYRGTIFGECLSPIVVEGTVCWFEAEAQWIDGDFAQVYDGRTGNRLLKQMRWANGLTIDGTRRTGWAMISNQPAMWVQPHHKVVGRLVCSLHGLPVPPQIADLSRRSAEEGVQLSHLVEEKLTELPRAIHA